jgi:hypothetical protein
MLWRVIIVEKQCSLCACILGLKVNNMRTVNRWNLTFTLGTMQFPRRDSNYDSYSDLLKLYLNLPSTKCFLKQYLRQLLTNAPLSHK